MEKLDFCSVKNKPILIFFWGHELFPNEIIPNEIIPNKIIPNKIIPNKIIPNIKFPNLFGILGIFAWVRGEGTKLGEGERD
jgi:hypothetical protein